MMSSSFGKKTVWVPLIAALFTMIHAGTARAQFGGSFQQIGGVHFDATGALNLATESELEEAREKLLASVGDVDPAIGKATKMRVVSVKGLEAALRHAVESGRELPDEIKYMAGIQRLEFVIADPENNDILIAGRGEGWIVDKTGNVVGETTGRPVLRFEDFIVALRTADDANRQYGISVSINPTEAGRTRFEKLKRQIRGAGGFNPEMRDEVEQAMGPQDISLTGVPEDSRLAQVLTAADFRMKRLAMGFETAAVPGIPSVLEIARTEGRTLDISPRFWLECNYDSVKKSADGMTWQISGPGAKALTESQLESKKVKDHPIAVRWARTMTEKFGELADADPVFAELQNVMDMAVVAAIIEKHRLLDVAKLDVPALTGADDIVSLPHWNVPQTVATQCSFVRIGRDWMVTASGGVQVDSWKVLDDVQIDESLATVAGTVRTTATGATWWNAVN